MGGIYQCHCQRKFGYFNTVAWPRAEDIHKCELTLSMVRDSYKTWYRWNTVGIVDTNITRRMLYYITKRTELRVTTDLWDAVIYGTLYSRWGNLEGKVGWGSGGYIVYIHSRRAIYKLQRVSNIRRWCLHCELCMIGIVLSPSNLFAIEHYYISPACSWPFRPFETIGIEEKQLSN